MSAATGQVPAAIIDGIEGELRDLARADRQVLTEPESKQILHRIGIPVTRPVLAAGPDEAAVAASQAGYPVVLKVVSDAIVHKSTHGGVALGVRDEASVREHYLAIMTRTRRAFPAARIEGIAVEATARPGLEVIIGLHRDPVFGPVLVFGLGGTLVELLGDVSMRAAPVSRAQAEQMTGEIRAAALLRGYRDWPARDVAAIADVIVAVARLGAIAEVESVDLNPVFAYEAGAGAIVADATITLRAAGPAPGGETGGGQAALPQAGLPRPGQYEAVPHETGPLHARSTVEDLGVLFSPRSVAIVGASNNLAKPGGRLVRYLLGHGYRGEVVLVNSREREIAGRQVYASLAGYPGDIDLVVLSVPVAALDGVIAEMAGKNVRCALVNASGFAETGADGQARQDRLVAALARQGVRLCGPNSIGVFSPASSFFAAFSTALEAPDVPVGSIGFITQSGALGGSVLTRAWREGIGFSRCVSSGNEADLSTADYIDYLVADEATTVISVFLEGVSDGRRLRSALTGAARAGVPVLVYKNGRSDVGARSVRSHTGSLAGADQVFSAVFRQAGAIRLHRVSHLYEVALAFARQPLPAGGRVAIVSTSGGACTVLADECADHGLQVPPLSPGTTAELAAVIPAFGSAENPVDVTAQIAADPQLMSGSLAAIMRDPAIDSVIVMLTTLTGPMAAQIAGGIADAVRGGGKTVLAVWTIAPELARDGIEILREAGLPVYQDPETAVAALAAMHQFRRHQEN